MKFYFLNKMKIRQLCKILVIRERADDGINKARA